MTDRGEEEEELEGLEELDVTNWAEDDELLRRRFEEKACHFLVLCYKEDTSKLTQS